MNAQVSRAGFSKVRLKAQRRILKFNLDCSRGDQCSLFYYFWPLVLLSSSKNGTRQTQTEKSKLLIFASWEIMVFVPWEIIGWQVVRWTFIGWNNQWLGHLEDKTGKPLFSSKNCKFLHFICKCFTVFSLCAEGSTPCKSLLPQSSLNWKLWVLLHL